MGGKKKGILRSVTNTVRGGFEKSTDSLGLGKGLGRTAFTAFTGGAGAALEAGSMGEDIQRAPSIARAEAKKQANLQQIEQNRLLGAANRQANEEASVAAATEDLANKKQKQKTKSGGRQSTILTGNQGLENTSLGNGTGKTLLGV